MYRRRNPDYQTQLAYRRFLETGAFSELVRYVRYQAREGNLPPEVSEILMSVDDPQILWGRIYQMREQLESPAGLPILVYLYTLPDETPVVYTTIDRWGSPHIHNRNVRGIRPHALISSIGRAGGAQFLNQIIQPYRIESVEIIHTIYAVEKLPFRVPDYLIDKLETIIVEKAQHARIAAETLAIVGTPNNIPVIRDYCIDHPEGASWTPIGMLDSIALLGRNAGIDALMEIIENNPIRAMVEYSTRALGFAVAQHNMMRIPEVIEFLQYLEESLRDYPTSSSYDLMGVRQTIRGLGLIQHWGHIPHQHPWRNFLGLIERRQAYWQRIRLAERLESKLIIES